MLPHHFINKNFSTYKADYKINLLADDDPFYKRCRYQHALHRRAGVWFTSSTIYYLLAPAVSAGFFLFITTVLKTERTVPSLRLNTILVRSMVCLSPDKRNMLMISLVPLLLPAPRFFAHITGAATAARPAADIILHS